MKICHVCKHECEDDAELCPICGADISGIDDSSEPQTEESEKTAKKQNLVFLAAIEDVVSSQIFKDILTDNGITFSSDDADDADGMRVTFGGGFVNEEIFVDAEDFDKAKELYEEFLASEPEFPDDFSFEDEDEAE